MSFSINRFSRKALLLVTAVFSASLLWAQTTGISGRVLDETGAPVIGATVMVKGTTIATATNVDGTFNLKNTDRNVTLVVSYVGYEAQQVSSKGAGSVTITLKPEPIGMESVEIVSVGYGTQKRESVVGAISTIRPEELRVPVRSLSQTLAGNLAGVVALQTSGEPGKDDAQFWIRGIATFTGSPDPLILVDGIERPLNDVDPLEIESFSVLKDASATAVYGVRGANGVILVNTRRGFDGPARIDLRYEQGFSFASKRLSFVDAATRSEMFNEAVDAVNASAALKYGADEIKAMRMQTDPEVYPDVDWQKLLMKKVSLSEKVSANISGGGKFARYFTALSFYNQEGQYAVKPGKYSWVSDKIGRYGENVNYKRYNFRSNVDMDITKTTVVNLGVQGNVTENMEPVEGSAAIYRDIINAAPNAFPVRFKDGELAGRDGLNNPYNMLTQRGWKKTTGNTLRANLTINQDFSFITPGLSAKVSYAYDAVNYSVEERARNINFFEATGRDQDGELIRTEWQADQKQEYLNYKQSGNGSRTQYVEAAINYSRTFGEKHEVGGLLLGFAKDYRLQEATSDYLKSLPNRSLGLAGRLTYAYDKRYLIEANIGFNGSENFAKGKRMGVFPAVAIGWVASEESFLRNSEVLTWFKIRASVGQVGNDQIPSTRFIYLATINSGANGYGNLGVNFDQGAGGIGEGRMANQDVTWEVSTKYNVGIETGFFNSLKINADFFYERRENIFLAPQFSEISGLPKDYTNYANMGLMENRGFEVSAEYVKRFNKDLTISVRGNFTFARNKVIDDGKYYAYPWQDQRGVRYGLTKGYRAMHLFSQEELDNMPDYYTQFGLDKQQLRAGDLRYEDLNDDGKITEADMTWIGNPAMPEIVYGFGASLNYKGFDFSFLFQGGANRSSYLSGGWYFYPFQADRGPKFMGNVMTMFKDRWTVDNPDPHAFSPRLSYGADANNYKTSTWWQRDSDYLRLKNVEIGYTLPSAWASKLRCSSLRIYATGVNLFTISKFISDYWDPETGADAYPMQRQVFVGVNLTF